MEEEFSQADDFLQNLQPYYKQVLQQFKKAVRFCVFFNLFFFLLFVGEIYAFSYFFLQLSQSLVAFTLAGIFLTIFSYFILLFYFQSKKPEQLKQLNLDFVQSCRELPYKEEEPYLLIAHAHLKLVDYLQDFEKMLYPFFCFRKFLEAFSKLMHFEDVFRFKQLFLESAIEEHYLHIRVSPLDLEAHTSLANIYTALSKNLLQAKKDLETTLICKAWHRKLYNTLEGAFRKASERAVEEFKILQYYVPEDPWVHLQLAKSYEALNMPKEEILEYEALEKLLPLDPKILSRLGALYFQQGFNGKGLILYEKLKQRHPKQADDLLCFYGKFTSAFLEELN